MLATTVISIAYTILQVAFSLYYVSTGNRVISGDGSFKFDFYGDKVISYVLATGGAAAFGVTKDMKVVFAGSGLTRPM
ncbi:CASP-like protein 4D1 isoform X1 [Pistacia vera]|uniref:CASP-like protein 4D1 isoform X1 n=1 Tax=Pistacia vera TaxID=55513 RepID=UPI0012637D16|nr:CASP-like protein 4D1 isoform X1 [Pistacia vera]